MIGKVKKVLLLGGISFQVLFLSSCSTFDFYADKAKGMAVETGQSLGLLTETRIEVPDYYSDEYLPKSYRAGQVEELKGLQCDKFAGCSK